MRSMSRMFGSGVGAGISPAPTHIPAEETKANTKAIKEIIEAIKAIGIIS